MEIRITREELSKKKLFVATPMYGGQCAGMFTRSMNDLSALCLRYGIEVKIYYLFNESLITRARNYCSDEFMRSNSTHLLFIDSDIGFNPQDILAMLTLMSDDSPYDVLAAPYPKKTIAWEKIKLAVEKGAADENPNNLERYVGDYVFNPVGGRGTIPIGEPVEVSEAGTGFMMIRKKTFEMFDKAYPQQKYRPDHVRTEHFDGTREITAYFDCIIDRGYTFTDVHNFMSELAGADKKDFKDIQAKAEEILKREEKASKRYLSEDYNFCYLVRRIGGQVWFCPWIKLSHVGSYVFGGSLADIAQIGAAATADVAAIKGNKKKPEPKKVTMGSGIGTAAKK